VFVALIPHVYGLPGVRPSTVIGLAWPDAVRSTPPLEEEHVTRNADIGAPLSSGVAKVTCTEPELDRVAVGFCGSPGAPTMTAVVFGESSPSPTRFRAETTNRYAFPFRRPVKTALFAVAGNSRVRSVKYPTYGVTR
jgi:hypothetical protein